MCRVVRTPQQCRGRGAAPGWRIPYEALAGWADGIDYREEAASCASCDDAPKVRQPRPASFFDVDLTITAEED